MQQNHARGIAVLNADPQADSGRARGVAQCSDQCDSLASAPTESLVFRHGVHHQQFRVMDAAERQRVIESRPRGRREIDCDQDPMKLTHVDSPCSQMRLVIFRR